MTNYRGVGDNRVLEVREFGKNVYFAIWESDGTLPINILISVEDFKRMILNENV